MDASVTHKECDSRHRTTKTQFTIMTATLVLLMTGITWSVYAGWSASAGTNDVKHDLDKHKAVSAERERAIRDDLADIKEMVKDLHKHIGP